jgi:hypothetical protein
MPTKIVLKKKNANDHFGILTIQSFKDDEVWKSGNMMLPILGTIQLFSIGWLKCLLLRYLDVKNQSALLHTCS